MIRVQQDDFDVNAEYGALRALGADIGAICCFTGLVREFGDRTDIRGLYLEHYPGMTEKALEKIVDQAKAKWPLKGVTVIHRVGELLLSDQIVLVAVASAHREAAFQACQFIMDYLKVDAPFWKKELTDDGAHWVEQKDTDCDRAKHW